MMKTKLLASAAVALALFATPSFADEAAAKKWIESEFTISAISKEDQMKEMQWFINAAKPFAGMEINVLSEGIPTHTYESTVLTKAFEEITGIKVNHQILGEGEVVQAVQTQMQTNRNLYDGYVNDSDLIGTHSRLQQTYNLTDASTLTISSASSSPRAQTASFISCRTNSLPTSTGSARTGLTALT
jgi:glycerol transport system substrate-binding protein